MNRYLRTNNGWEDNGLVYAPPYICTKMQNYLNKNPKKCMNIQKIFADK